jgi:GrpB-like predicted nucleotidyltransferase (UPF0157 family)
LADSPASPNSSLDDRLRQAGVGVGDPFAAWLRLRAFEGRRATLIDLYRLVASARGVEPHELSLSERRELSLRAVEVMFPGFQVAPDSDRDVEPIRIVPPDGDWPVTFERWRARLQRVLGATALRIEHVGSTSVPGLAAKPIVDIQVSVADLEDERAFVGRVERSGVHLRSRDSEHRYFRPPRDRPHDCHVHVCEAGSPWERDHLLFRDYLRARPDRAEGYAAVKRAAALIWSDDGWGFTEAKSEFIPAALAEADDWAESEGWSVVDRRAS